MGWIGDANQMLHALRVAGADQDEGGRFKIYGEPPYSFLGLGQEFVISDKTEYSVNGKRASLAGLLGSTSYGHKVTVIS